jgi:hypothetical protein
LALPEFAGVQAVDCDCDFEATESLVVRRELAQEPAIGQLRERLTQSYLAEIVDHPGVSLCASS